VARIRIFASGKTTPPRSSLGNVTAAVLCLCAAFLPAVAQNPGTSAAGADTPLQLVVPSGPSAPPVTITLRDAIERARRLDAQTLAAVADAKIAHDERTVARAALLPNISYSTQFLGTQGNGLTPNGRYVTNDGVQVYRSWGVLHQEVSANTLLGTSYRRASAAEAQAQAKAEIAQRGLVVTVTKNYYALVIAQRKYAGAQQNAEQARRFLTMTQDAERLRQVAHSDVVKADVQYQQLAQSFEEANLALETARLNLAVLLSPTLNENFTVTDDLDSAVPLPPFPEVQGMAERQNPDIRVAIEALRQANLDVTAAKTAFLPSVTFDTDYGIEANAYALNSVNKAFPNLGKLPNLGYFVTANLTLPVWNWGSLRSKLHETEVRREQAHVELTQAQRQMLSTLYASYNEAAVARAAVERLGHAADLAAESSRLVNLRYRAGTSTALEAVDAQNTLIQARNAFYDAQARYRVALATLQTFTGNF
jgi:outer membrane protein TolC